jgi:glycosyltransferase involved in cell wall biosynthesis
MNFVEILTYSFIETAMNRSLSIVTPALNAEKYIEKTMLSVINNTLVAREEIKLQYIIVDGLSQDDTIPIVKKIISSTAKPNISFKLLSEPDSGMYDAISKGIGFAEGEYCAYLNAGDIYSIHAFEIASEIFTNYDIKWLCGSNIQFNEQFHLIGYYSPTRYRSKLIKYGVYGTYLNFIPQASVIWHNSLTKRIDFLEFRTFKLAGDFYLWKSFSQFEDLFHVSAFIGGFRIHRGQLSEGRDKYFSEFNRIRNKYGLYVFFLIQIERLIRILPSKFKRHFSKGKVFCYSSRVDKYELL